MLVSSAIQSAKTMPSSPDDNSIMTIGEIADHLKGTDPTLYRLVGAKQIAAFKIEGSWHFSKVDNDGWIKKQSLEGTEDSDTRSDQPKKLAARGDK